MFLQKSIRGPNAGTRRHLAALPAPFWVDKPEGQCPATSAFLRGLLCPRGNRASRLAWGKVSLHGALRAGPAGGQRGNSSLESAGRLGQAASEGVPGGTQGRISPGHPALGLPLLRTLDTAVNMGSCVWRPGAESPLGEEAGSCPAPRRGAEVRSQLCRLWRAQVHPHSHP